MCEKIIIMKKNEKKIFGAGLVWATVQLYCDQRFCIAREGFEWLKLYCNRVLYCNGKARLAWVKTVSRYNYCIVTEPAGVVLVRSVLKYTWCIVTEARLRGVCVAIHLGVL